MDDARIIAGDTPADIILLGITNYKQYQYRV